MKPLVVYTKHKILFTIKYVHIEILHTTGTGNTDVLKNQCMTDKCQTYSLLFHTSMSITNVGKEERNIKSKQIGTTKTGHNVTSI